MKNLFLLYVLIISFTKTVAQNFMETKQITINSDIYGTTRSFRLALPEGMPSDTKYNLIFVLDANYIFDIIASTALYLQTYDYIAPTAVVAVDYSTPGNRSDIGFSLGKITLNNTGEKFYDYINTEILSHIETLLPTTGFNTLIGHSYTASYLLYYLKNHNSKFSSYILFAPESTATTPFPADFHTGKADNQLIIRILTGDKDIEARKNYGKQLFDKLEEVGYENVKLETFNSDHMSLIPDGMSAALQSLYCNYLNVDRIYDIWSNDTSTIGDLFLKVEQLNACNYRQTPRVTGGHIAFFLGEAIKHKDTESINMLTDFYARALDCSHPDPNALGVMGELLKRMGKWEEAEYYFQRSIEEYDAMGLAHETWYWRQHYALDVLATLGKLDQAWQVLDECKSIFKDDSIAFSYYQGVLAVKNNFRIQEGILLLESALEYPAILEENLISIDDVKMILENGKNLNKD